MKIVNLHTFPIQVTYQLPNTVLQVTVKNNNNKWTAEAHIPEPNPAESPAEAAKNLGDLLLQLTEGIMSGADDFNNINLNDVDLT